MNTLGEFRDAIDMVKTACVALETDERTTFAVPCLQLSLEMLQKVYNEFDYAASKRAVAPHVAEEIRAGLQTRRAR